MIIVPRSKCGAESVGNGPDRTSAATMRANQLRLWFASMAYVLLCRLALDWGKQDSNPRSPG